MSVKTKATEQYKRTPEGLKLIKTDRHGVVTEIPLTNFDAQIISETPSGSHVTVRSWFNGKGKITTLPAREWDRHGIERPFDERLLAEVLSVHPRAMMYPGKRRHVLTAIKTLSKPRIEAGADNKTNNGSNKKRG